jgi:hypothetical protein
MPRPALIAGLLVTLCLPFALARNRTIYVCDMLDRQEGSDALGFADSYRSTLGKRHFKPAPNQDSVQDQA